MNIEQMKKFPPLPFAVFDEFGQACEDRVNDHYHAARDAQWNAAQQRVLAEQAVPVADEGYVAWLRYENHEGQSPTAIHLCDSDEPGAFKVWRHPSKAEPFAYACPAKCGRLWRDNKDGSMSLFGPKSNSCVVCEPMGLDQLVKVYAAPVAQPATEQAEAPRKLGTFEHRCPAVTGHRGGVFVCQSAGHGVSQNSYCKDCTCPAALATQPTASNAGEREWSVLPLSAEILHLDDDMLRAVLAEIRANVRAALASKPTQ